MAAKATTNVAVAKPAGAAAATPGQRSAAEGFTRKWLIENHRNPQPFDEELFSNVFSVDTLTTKVDEIKAATEAKVAESKRLLAEDFTYFLQLTSHRMPHFSHHLCRIVLPHSVLNEDSSVCIFVKDQKRFGKKLDYETTIKHYETLFRNKKIDITSISFVPISQLFNEYVTADQRRKLSFIYELYLVDQDIAVKVNAFLGTKVLADSRAAFPVNLTNAAELHVEIHESLRKVFYRQFDQQAKPLIKIGRHSTPTENVVANIVDCLRQLEDVHPGGCKNVFKIHIKPNVYVNNTVELYVDNEPPTPVEAKTDEKASADGEDGDVTMEEKKEDLCEPVHNQGFSIVPYDYILYDSETVDYDARKTIDFSQNKMVPLKKTTDAQQKNGQPQRNGNNANGGANAQANNISNLILANIKKLLGGNNGARMLQGAGGNGNRTGNNTTLTNRIVKRYRDNNNVQNNRRAGNNVRNQRNSGNPRFI